MTPQIQRLITLLQKQPNVLFAILQEFHNSKIAGPWTPSPNNHTKKSRRSPQGKTLASVYKHPEHKLWKASTCKPSPSSERPSKLLTSQSQALDWCDQQLTSQGFILTD